GTTIGKSVGKPRLSHSAVVAVFGTTIGKSVGKPRPPVVNPRKAVVYYHRQIGRETTAVF
ncbi:MAG: hypothetical protein WCY11_16165, partial [Novosphingobium sp.]